MSIRRYVFVALFAMLGCANALGAERAYFTAPQDGATVKSPFVAKFALEGMQIGKLGDLTPGTGHHHLIVDGGPVAKGEVIPADAAHLHFGKGQTEVELKLAPGEHELTLQFADGAHRSYGPLMSQSIKVHVARSPLAR